MMTKYRDRDTLKKYFQHGSIPTAEQFEELIDSITNINDDGHVLNSKNMPILYPIERGDTLLEIYSQEPQIEKSEVIEKPCWSVVLDSESNIHILDVDRNPIIFSKKNKNEVCLKARMDKEWHSLAIEKMLADQVRGCRSYRILAWYIDPKSKRYELTEAIASHIDGRKLTISSNKKHLGIIWFGKIKLRWRVQGDELQLQIRSRVKRPNIYIKCDILKLWDCAD